MDLWLTNLGATSPPTLEGIPPLPYRRLTTEKVLPFIASSPSCTAASLRWGIMLWSELLILTTSILLGMCPFVASRLSTVLHVTRLPFVKTVA